MTRYEYFKTKVHCYKAMTPHGECWVGSFQFTTNNGEVKRYVDSAKTKAELYKLLYRKYNNYFPYKARGRNPRFGGEVSFTGKTTIIIVKND